MLPIMKLSHNGVFSVVSFCAATVNSAHPFKIRFYDED